ncbi:MAG: homoserine dehydrogenase [Candidatus Omnitrophica bacterium]|nr:homoserine dehydrogenase [Candidatus Omnitrophota bacterium]
MKGINVGLLGFGTVGSGVVKILKEKQTLLQDKIGTKIVLKKICDKNIELKRIVKIDKDMLTTDPYEVITDPQIDILIELIGGINPAKEYIMEALKNGKHIVTANKALLAQEGKEIFATAKKHQRCVYFEASVGAGIPIIKSIREGLIANRFLNIHGILNGTSNFILTRMSEDNFSFREALKEAKKQGYAEADPRLDIEGIDSAHKLIILAYLCYGKLFDINDIYVEGISRISSADIIYAKDMGFNIKLLAIAKKIKNELEMRIHPTLIPYNHLLSSVRGIFNAIYISADLVDDLLFYGPGAGQMSAASAVVADLVDLTRHIKAGIFSPVMEIIEDRMVGRLKNIEDIESRYYIRFLAIDKPGVLAKIAGILGKYQISIASVTQKERKKQKIVPIVMITHEAKEKNLKEALFRVGQLNVIKDKPVAIRIEEL